MSLSTSEFRVRLVPLIMFKLFSIFTDLFKAVLFFVIYVSCLGDICTLPGTVVQSVHITYDKWGHMPTYPLNCIHVTCIYHINRFKKPSQNQLCPVKCNLAMFGFIMLSCSLVVSCRETAGLSALLCVLFLPLSHMSRGMRFATMWYVRPAKAQTSLRIRTV